LYFLTINDRQIVKEGQTEYKAIKYNNTNSSVLANQVSRLAHCKYFQTLINFQQTSF